MKHALGVAGVVATQHTKTLQAIDVGVCVRFCSINVITQSVRHSKLSTFKSAFSLPVGTQYVPYSLNTEVLRSASEYSLCKVKIYTLGSKFATYL